MVNPSISNERGIMPLCVAILLTFLRLLTWNKAIGSRAGRSLLPFEILEILDRELRIKRYASECTPAYLAAIRTFVTDQIANQLGEVRRSYGMFDALTRDEEWDADTDLSMGASGRSRHTMTGIPLNQYHSRRQGDC
jgi:DNA-directed RNA polymerase III subunit RPC1